MEEGFQFSFMAEASSQNRQPPSQNRLFFNLNDFQPQVPSFHSNFSFRQNSNSGFHYGMFSNPNGSQTYPAIQTQTHSFTLSYQGLEDAFRRVSLNMPHNNDNPPMFIGATASDSARLHRMRIESAVRGQRQIDYYNEGLWSGHLNSTFPLGAPSSRSANFPSTPIANDFDVIQRSRSLDELAYACRHRRPINNIDFQLRPRLGNHSTWDVNGLESPNPIINHPQEQLRFSSLKELKGRVSSFAKDQNGCRLLQREFDNGMISREEMEMILSEVKIDLHDLMVHQFANYLIQKAFKASNHQQRTELLLLLVTGEERFLEVCTDTHGTRTVQKILEQITSQEHRLILLSTLRHIVVILMKDTHGHHIIERCLYKFSDEDTRPIVDEIAKHLLEIATDKGGCCVLQQCLLNANAEVRDRILAEVIAIAFVLSEDRYGNYVVQYVLEMGLPHVTSKIIMQLRGSYVNFSTNKFGSNVVEKCLRFSGKYHLSMIIKEIMFHEDFVKVIQDAYGNYVVQSALKLSKGDLHTALVKFILRHYPVLHSHLYGKMVVERIRCSKNRVQYK